MLSGLNFAVGLALVACVVGGVRGGLLLAAAMGAAPGDAAAATTDPDDKPGGGSSGGSSGGHDPIGVRAFAAALLIVHAATAAVLGYSAGIGQGMALALGLGWIAAAAVRFWSARGVGEKPRGALVELLTGLALALPAWMAMASLGGGAVI